MVHPDVAGDEAQERSAFNCIHLSHFEVQEMSMLLNSDSKMSRFRMRCQGAFEVLKNPEKRSAYDASWDPNVRSSIRQRFAYRAPRRKGRGRSDVARKQGVKRSELPRSDELQMNSCFAMLCNALQCFAMLCNALQCFAAHLYYFEFSIFSPNVERCDALQSCKALVSM